MKEKSQSGGEICLKKVSLEHVETLVSIIQMNLPSPQEKQNEKILVKFFILPDILAEERVK